MRKYLLVLAAAMIAALTGCSKDDNDSVDSSVAGQWQLTTWNAETPGDFEVYLELLSNGNFNIFQKVGTSVFVSYTGKFQTAGSLMSGTYSDGMAWGAVYTYSISADRTTLTLVTDTTPEEVSVYSRTTIPDDVRAASAAADVTLRSSSDERPL